MVRCIRLRSRPKSLSLVPVRNYVGAALGHGSSKLSDDMKANLAKLKELHNDGLISKEALMNSSRKCWHTPLAPPSTHTSGTRIGAYRIIDTIGQGGMGVVYRGRHRMSGVAKREGGDVAIKVMHAQYAQDEAHCQRFEREAEPGMKLDHSGIVKVHNLFVDGGNLALVMELASGRDMSKMIGGETRPNWRSRWPRSLQWGAR